MQSNFESLSTADLTLDGGNHVNNSISNQYREGSAVQRNAVTIARAQSLRDTDQNRRREELQKRIEETRKKLQHVSWGSSNDDVRLRITMLLVRSFLLILMR